MGKKGKKTRWRRLPIGGTQEEGGLSLDGPPPTTDSHRVTFNEDEYTKITTPRQDVLFKKGYFGRKRNPNPSPSDGQEVHSGDSVESESYVSEEPQYVYPAGYIDPSGVYYVNGNTFETYDPYTGTVTVVVGPPAQYPGGPPVLAAVPCQPVPLQPVEWFNPAAAAPWYYSYNRHKRYSTDSQNCSAQSSESTGPPGSPQEPVDEGACAMYPPPPPPQYVYPGYMFGPPIYNMNGMTVQGVIPQPVPVQPDPSASKRRKKRRRRRRGGVTDDGSESSCCEEPLTCDMPGCQSETSSDAVCQSGASSDAGAGPGSSSSKANSDSGINTDPTPNSGSNSPPPQDLAQQIETINDTHFECPVHVDHVNEVIEKENTLSVGSAPPSSLVAPLCLKLVNDFECEVKEEDQSQCEEKTPEEVSEELSTTEDDITPNLCAAAPEFSSQESTLSCLSTPSVTRDLMSNEHDLSNTDKFQDELFESCQSVSEKNICDETDSLSECAPFNGDLDHTLSSEAPTTLTTYNDLETSCAETIEEIKEHEVCSHHIEDSQIPSHKLKVHLISEIPTITSEFESVETFEVAENSINYDETEIRPIIHEDKAEIGKVNEEEYFICTIENLGAHSTSESEYCLSRHPTHLGTEAPVPPPRRKRSLCRAADKLASKIVEDAIKEGIEEAVTKGLRRPISITEAVTRWLNSQGKEGKLPINFTMSESESEDDEGIELAESLTDQKNVQGNPFLVPSHNGMGQRVAKDCESINSSAGEWDMWDNSHTREMCDPTRSVDKYYRLGADADVADKMPPSVYKTAMHIHHSGPFPCGVCCIIQ